MECPSFFRPVFLPVRLSPVPTRLSPPHLYVYAWFAAGIFFLTGCSSDPTLARQNAEQAATIRSLNLEIERLNQEMDDLMRSREELAGAMEELQKRLKG